ncbi:MAG: cob(I)yrinic acid a,c-diamide adenosyltransferase [Flavobacteriaceae bacterium]|nr:cob(I)yrinic acid a,c-diamide adenosyltransferase [Flavobacteriaceae bacterium]
MKIYTKTGDKGLTSLYGGLRVSKYHLRIEAYGTMDELNSYLGLLRDQQVQADVSGALLKIQNELFTIGAMLATPNEKTSPKKTPNKVTFTLDADAIAFLEREIDAMDAVLPELKNFILPGGHPAVSICHIARTVCRRAERITVLLHEKEGVDDAVLVYLNRLSDYLFVLARKLSHDNRVDEIPWISKK